MTIRPRRTRRPGPTDAEWSWLLAEPDCNQFLGYATGDPSQLTTPDRIRELWEEHEDEIRLHWNIHGYPEELPYGHPAAPPAA